MKSWIRIRFTYFINSEIFIWLTPQYSALFKIHSLSFPIPSDTIKSITLKKSSDHFQNIWNNKKMCIPELLSHLKLGNCKCNSGFWETQHTSSAASFMYLDFDIISHSSRFLCPKQLFTHPNSSKVCYLFIKKNMSVLWCYIGINI